jgi:hypothetical protein
MPPESTAPLGVIVARRFPRVDVADARVREIGAADVLWAEGLGVRAPTGAKVVRARRAGVRGEPPWVRRNLELLARIGRLVVFADKPRESLWSAIEWAQDFGVTWELYGPDGARWTGPVLPSDPRPEGRPYYAAASCSRCGGELVSPGLVEEWKEVEDEWFPTEFACAACGHGIIVDRPPEDRRLETDDMRTFSARAAQNALARHDAVQSELRAALDAHNLALLDRSIRRLKRAMLIDSDVRVAEAERESLLGRHAAAGNLLLDALTMNTEDRISTEAKLAAFERLRATLRRADVGAWLYLDDERPTPDGWERVYTARQATARLARGGVTRVSLDHDLGPPEAGTGYDVACWIEQNAAEGRLARIQWAMHSANPVGRARMEQALRSADRHWASALAER